jgi:nucleoside-diphosphate-sugar epimerase
MRVLVTGAGGTLGTALASMLAEAGHEPVLQDVRPLQRLAQVLIRVAGWRV